MKNDRIQTGLRIPQARYEELAALADEAGISLNTFALVLMDIGLKAINLGIQKEGHSLLRNLRDIS